MSGPVVTLLAAAQTPESVVQPAERWAKTNREWLELVAGELVCTGEWPSLRRLERRALRERAGVAVLDVGETLPAALGVVNGAERICTLNARALRHVPAAAPLLAALLRVIRIAVGRYVNEDGEPTLRRHDLRDGPDGTDEVLVGRLLLDAEDWLVGSGHGGPGDNWEREITDAARHLHGVDTLDGYLAAQAEARYRLPARAVSLTSQPAPAAGPVVLGLADLHPVVADACGTLFEDGHYAEGLHRAAIALHHHVARRAGRPVDLDGHDLMGAAFGGQAPAITVADLATRSGQNMQRGTREIAQGIVAAVRNPAAHELPVITTAEAMEITAMLSWVARRADGMIRSD